MIVWRVYAAFMKSTWKSQTQAHPKLHMTFHRFFVIIVSKNSKMFFQLFDFIDELQDLACFVYKGNSKSYQPFNREWIKEKIYSLLKKQATGK